MEWAIRGHNACLSTILRIARPITDSPFSLRFGKHWMPIELVVAVSLTLCVVGPALAPDRDIAS